MVGDFNLLNISPGGIPGGIQTVQSFADRPSDPEDGDLIQIEGTGQIYRASNGEWAEGGHPNVDDISQASDGNIEGETVTVGNVVYTWNPTLSSWEPNAEKKARQVRTVDGDTYDPDFASSDPASVVNLVNSDELPYFKDLSGTLTREGWFDPTTADRVLFGPNQTPIEVRDEALDIYNDGTVFAGNNIYNTTSDLSYRISGDLTARAVISHPVEMLDSSYGFTGKAKIVAPQDPNENSQQSHNIYSQWSFEIDTGDMASATCLYQYGSSNASEGSWEMPYSYRFRQVYVLTMVREGGDTLSMYVNGQKLRNVRNTTNATVQSDGTIVGDQPQDGGSDARFCLFDRDSWDGAYNIHNIQIFDRAVSAQEEYDFVASNLPSARILETPTEVLDSMASESGTVELLTPDASDGTWDSYIGGPVEQGGWSSTGSVETLVTSVTDDQDYATGQWIYGEGPDPLHIQGTLLIRVFLSSNWNVVGGGNDSIIVDYSNFDRGEPGHVQYRIRSNLASSGSDGFFYKHEMTQNGSTDFAQQLLFDGLIAADRDRDTREPFLLTFERVDNGDGTYNARAFKNGEVLPPESVENGSASISGDRFVDIPETTGGELGDIRIHQNEQNHQNHFCHIKQGTTTQQREQDLYEALTTIGTTL